MGELLSGGEGQFRTQGVGTPGTAGGGSGVALSVSEALDTDLDSYLDRELFVGTRTEPGVLQEALESSASGSMRALLDLAEAEAEWLETLPPPLAAPVEQKREPAEPPVVIPEWMRAEPGTEGPVFSAVETAAHVLHESAVAGLPWGSAAGTDVSGMPMTPWSVPTSEEPRGAERAHTLANNLLPGIPAPPPVAPVPPAWTQPAAMPVPTVQPAWAPPSMAAAPVPSWAPPAVPMASYSAQPWGPAPVEERRIAGMKPGAFLGAAAVGALAAGLLVVAGLHVRDRVMGAPGVQASGTLRRAEAPPSGTASRTDGSIGTHASAGAVASGVAGTQPPGVASAQPGPGIAGTRPSGAEGTLIPGGLGVQPPGAEGTLVPGALAGLPPGAVSPPPGTPGTQPGAVGTRHAGTQPGAVVSPAPAGSTVLTRARASSEPAREPSARKAAPKARVVPASTVTEDASAEEETAEARTGEVSFDDAETSGSSPESNEAAVSAAQARPRGEYADLDEDFARELGFTEDTESKARAPQSTRTVYIPPAPDAKEHLTPDDVKQVVVTNQPAITACIRQHAKGTPVEGGGRFLVKWSVLPAGDTTQVSMDTDTLRATPLARCIEDVVRRWKFPAHRVRMQEPIRFPFVF